MKQQEQSNFQFYKNVILAKEGGESVNYFLGDSKKKFENIRS